MRRYLGLVLVSLAFLGISGAALASSDHSPETGDLARVAADGPGEAGGPVRAVTPAPAAGIDFTGVWQTNVSSGIGFRMTLLQDAAGAVIGHFTPPNGVIVRGAVVGNELFADWSQAGITGRLVFTMAAGGNTFTGYFTTGDRPVTPEGSDGAWHGTRDPGDLATFVEDPAFAAGAGVRITSFATLTSGANVRAGPARNTRSLTTLPDGATVPVVGCDDGWCEVSVPGLAVTYIARSLLRMNARPPRDAAASNPPAAAASGAARPIPAPPIPPGIPAPIPLFAGTWATVTGTGDRLRMVLEQDEAAVTGRYAPGGGAIQGTIRSDGRLVFRWSETDGSVGMGVFDLSRDGRTMAGSYNTSAEPLTVAGSWFGTRTGNP